MQSETIGKLASALAKVQAGMTALERNRTVVVETRSGGTYEFSYTTFDAILSAVREPLASNGLAFVQIVEPFDPPHLVTRLLHESGEWVSSALPIRTVENGPQAFGSALTYAKRYGLAAMLGVSADDDDDGNTGEGNSSTVTRDSEPRKSPSKSPSKSGRIACPKCGVEAVIKSKYAAKGGPYKGQFPRVCVKKFGGCGAEFSPDGPMPDPKSNDVPQYIRANGESVPIPAINDHHLDAAIAALEKGLASAESVNGNTVATLDALKAEKAARIKKDAEDLGF